MASLAPVSSSSSSSPSPSSSSSSSSSNAVIVPRNYIVSTSRSLRDHCAECHSPLQHDKGNGKGKGKSKGKGKDKGEQERVLLCSVCSVLSFCLLGIPEFPGPDFFLNPLYLERKLEIEFDIHWPDYNALTKTKVYTCTKCAGMMHFTNPFKYCMSCIREQYPLFIRKENAMTVLVRLPQLKTIETLQPYFLKRRILCKERRLASRTVHDMTDSYDSLEFPGTTITYTIDGQQKVLHVPACSRFSDSKEDFEALKGVQVARRNAVMESCDMIPEVINIVSSYEDPRVDAQKMHAETRHNADLLEQQLGLVRNWLQFRST